MPPEFLPAIGYEGDAEFVAVWWDRCGDEASWSDGRSTATGQHQAYSMLVDYPPNAVLLYASKPGRWSLGSSETEATHWLLINQQTYTAWLVPTEVAQSVLQSQWDSEPAMPLTDEQLQALLFAARETPVTGEHLSLIFEKQEQNLHALKAALNLNAALRR